MARESLSKSAHKLNARIPSTLVLMRVAATRGETVRAIGGLRALLGELEALQNRGDALDVAMALGDLEVEAGRPEGRSRLARVEQEARSRGFFRVARLAREALERKPTSWRHAGGR
jgi:hypothetical protein